MDEDAATKRRSNKGANRDETNRLNAVGDRAVTVDRNIPLAVGRQFKAQGVSVCRREEPHVNVVVVVVFVKCRLFHRVSNSSVLVEDIFVRNMGSNLWSRRMDLKPSNAEYQIVSVVIDKIHLIHHQ